MGRPKPPTPMRVLVNDASGWGGRAVVDALKKDGHSVVALTAPDQDAPDGLDELRMGDITPEFIESLLQVCRLALMCTEDYCLSCRWTGL